MRDIKDYLKQTNTVLLTKDAFEHLKERASALDKIRAEIEQAADKQFQIAMGVADLNERYTHIQMENAYRHSLEIIDKHLQNPQAVDERVDEKVDRAFDKLLGPFKKGEN